MGQWIRLGLLVVAAISLVMACMPVSSGNKRSRSSVGSASSTDVGGRTGSENVSGQAEKAVSDKVSAEVIDPHTHDDAEHDDHGDDTAGIERDDEEGSDGEPEDAAEDGEGETNEHSEGEPSEDELDPGLVDGEFEESAGGQPWSGDGSEGDVDGESSDGTSSHIGSACRDGSGFCWDAEGGQASACSDNLGNYSRGQCLGGSNIQCCTGFICRTDDDQEGTCRSSCNGATIAGLCPGGSDITCCLEQIDADTGGMMSSAGDSDDP